MRVHVPFSLSLGPLTCRLSPSLDCCKYAAMNTQMSETQNSFPMTIFPEMGLRDCRVILFLAFWGTSTLFSRRPIIVFLRELKVSHDEQWFRLLFPSFATGVQPLARLYSYLACSVNKERQGPAYNCQHPTLIWEYRPAAMFVDLFPQTGNYLAYKGIRDYTLGWVWK